MINLAETMPDINSLSAGMPKILGIVEQVMNGSVQHAELFFGWMKDSLGIGNFSDLSTTLLEMAKKASDSGGVLGTVLSSFYSNVAKGIEWMSGQVSNALTAGSAKAGMAFGNVTYNTLFAFAAISAVVMFIVYKICKVVKNSAGDTVSENKMQLRAIKNVLQETNTMFDELYAITESDNSNTNSGIIEKIIEKAANMVSYVWNWVKAPFLKEDTSTRVGLSIWSYFAILCIIIIGILSSYVIVGKYALYKLGML